jgi:hypothetical protein
VYRESILEGWLKKTAGGMFGAKNNYYFVMFSNHVRFFNKVELATKASQGEINLTCATTVELDSKVQLLPHLLLLRFKTIIIIIP